MKNSLNVQAPFQAIRIRLASPERIILWGTTPQPKKQNVWRYTTVEKAETINYRTFKPEKDEIYKVKAIKILEFGAVVEYLEAPGNEVLLHISEMAWERTNAVTDVVNVGDEFDVKYLGFDPRTRKDKVSRKALLDKPEGYVERPPRKGGGGGRDRKGGRDNRNRR